MDRWKTIYIPLIVVNRLLLLREREHGGFYPSIRPSVRSRYEMGSIPADYLSTHLSIRPSGRR